MSDPNEEQMMAIAAQLRRPQGEYADEIARKMNEANVHLNRYTIAALDLRPGNLILEVGMGNACFVPEILSSDPSIHYVGCDYSEEMVTAATNMNKVAVREGRAIFHCAAADALPLPDATVDTILAINTIYFWDSPISVLTEFFRVLRPGGKLVIGIRPKRSMAQYPFTRYGFTMYSREELVALLANASFPVSEIIEKEEPEQEIDGERFVVESLIVISMKHDFV